MRTRFAIPGPAVAAVTAAVALAAPAWGGFEPGCRTTVNAEGAFPGGVACWGDDGGFFLLDTGWRCPGGCSIPQHTDQDCPGSLASRLLRVSPKPGGRGWWFKVIHNQLPAGAKGLVSGPGSTLTTSLPDGGYLRLHLARNGAGWHVRSLKPLLCASVREALGLPPKGSSFLVDDDGSLILGQSHGVVRVPWERGKDEGSQWLVGGSFDQWKGKAGQPWSVAGDRPGDRPESAFPGPGVALARDAGGNVLVLHPETRRAFRLDPATRHLSLVADSKAWPDGFTPLEAGAFGDQFFVAGVLNPEEPVTRFVTLIPGEHPGAYKIRRLDVAMEAGGTFGFTPAGTLLICEPEEGRVLRVANGRATGPTPLGDACDNPDGDLAFLDTASTWDPGEREQDLPVALAAAMDLGQRGRFKPAFQRWLERCWQGSREAVPHWAGKFPRAAKKTPAEVAGGRFFLSPPTLARVAQAMLRNLDRANALATEVAWCMAPTRSVRRFSYGAYLDQRSHRMTVEVYDLRRFEPMAGLGEPVVSDLGRCGDRTGTLTGLDRLERPVHGLTLVLDLAQGRIESFRPSGRTTEAGAGVADPPTLPPADRDLPATRPPAPAGQPAVETKTGTLPGMAETKLLPAFKPPLQAVAPPKAGTQAPAMVPTQPSASESVETPATPCTPIQPDQRWRED